MSDASQSRLYYTDAHLTMFSATVVESLTLEGRPVVVLDRTAFYPTSGGQPHDTGLLGETPVVDVVDLEDGRVAHVLERGLEAGKTTEGRIDWPRRFDHMQQHTGQHILSAAFEHVCGARTVSFHLGSAASTIDLASAVDAGFVAAAEDEANRVVWEDRAVTVRFVSAEEASTLPLRKEPVRSGTLRLVDVDGFDLSACGGTHVTRTGAVGVIAVAGWERFKGGTRVEFACGGRALARFRALRDAVAGSVQALSVLPNELPSAIARLQADARAQKQHARRLLEQLVPYEAAELAERRQPVRAGFAVVEVVADRDVQSLKALAAAIATRDDHVAVLVGADAPSALVVARGAAVALDARELLRDLTARFGGKGGGKPDLAQGGSLTAAPHDITAAARAWLAERT